MEWKQNQMWINMDEEVFKSEEKDLLSTIIFSQEQAFVLVNKHIADLKKGKKLKDYCIKNDINYRSLISLSYSKNKKLDHQNDLKTSPLLILKFMKLIYKNVEIKKEIYYKVIIEPEAGFLHISSEKLL